MFEIVLMVMILLISLLIVIKAADTFVDNIVEIGTAFGVSQLF